MTAKKIIPKILILVFVLGFGGLCFMSGSITKPEETQSFFEKILFDTAKGRDRMKMGKIPPRKEKNDET